MTKDILITKWRPYALITLIGSLLYANSVFFGFVDYDDRHLIVTNQPFISNLSNIFKAFVQDIFNVAFHYSSKSYYRPMLSVSLMFDAQIGGSNLMVYHVTNIVIHIASCCLLFLLFTKFEFRKSISLFFSLIILVHPLLSQAVVWIPGRNDSLLVLFSIAAILFFIQFVKEKKRVYFIFHLLLFAMAIFTKETAIGLICIFILLLYIPKKTGLSITHKASLCVGWAAVTAIWLVLRNIAVVNPGLTIGHIANSVFLNLPGLVQYIGKILFPVNLSVYPIMNDMPLIYGVAAIFLISLLTLLSKARRSRIAFLGAAWLVIFILPALVSAKPGAGSLFHEHRVYLPMVGLLMVIMELDFIKRIDFYKPLHVVICAISLIALSGTTVAHSNSMKDAFSFWSNAISTSPSSPVGHINLGDQYYKKRMLDQAEAEFRMAIKLDPVRPMAHNNLGLIYAVRQQFKQAEKEFMTELEINPGYERSLFNLGMIYYDQGRFKDAIHFWEKTLEQNPYNIKANRYLAYFFYRQGDMVKAKHHIVQLQKRGVKVNPEHFKLLNIK